MHIIAACQGINILFFLLSPYFQQFNQDQYRVIVLIYGVKSKLCQHRTFTDGHLSITATFHHLYNSHFHPCADPYKNVCFTLNGQLILPYWLGRMAIAKQFDYVIKLFLNMKLTCNAINFELHRSVVQTLRPTNQQHSMGLITMLFLWLQSKLFQLLWTAIVITSV